MIGKSRWIKSFSEIAANYKYFIFDCDGVIWKENLSLDGTVTYINKLSEKSNSVFFLTNNNSKPRSVIFEKLKTFGINTSLKYVYNSSFILAKYLSQSYPEIKTVYAIGREGVKTELESVGIKAIGTTEDDQKTIGANMNEFKRDYSEIQAVVVGYDNMINYYKMVVACQIVDENKKFFGTNYDVKLKVGDKFFPGSYANISMIETSTEKKAEIISKPNKYSLEVILKDHQVDSSAKNKILMIGDNLRTDILFANNCEIDSCLVFTGVTRKNDYMRYSEEELSKLPKPTFVLEDFST